MGERMETTTSSLTSALAKVPIFNKLGQNDLLEIGKYAVMRTYPKNVVIVNEGDNADSLYFILSGRVKVFVSDENGKEMILNEQKPFEYFGELALIDDAKRSASVMTTEKSSFAVLSKDNFNEMLTSRPGIAIGIIKDLVHRVRLLTDNVKNLALLDVYGRVARVLLDLAQETEGELLIAPKPTQQELANRVGASREMVARILKDLERGHYISYQPRKILINHKLPSRY